MLRPGSPTGIPLYWTRCCGRNSGQAGGGSTLRNSAAVADGAGRGYADTVIRSMSGAQAPGLEKVIVLTPAVRLTVILTLPGVL